jgi:hypothetical protein
VRDGVAEKAGVLTACTSVSPAILSAQIPIGETELGHDAACHLVTPPPTT